jgi:small conductance mechanosensitive channel
MGDFFRDIDWSRWAETTWTQGARVIVIVLVVYVAVRILKHLLEPAVRRAVVAQMPGQPSVEIDKRVETLSQVGDRLVSIIAVLAVLITVLPEFGINAGALLAGAGIAGLAIGFGAQSLVKDVIAGLFILLENQYAKGDVVNLAGVGGLVEDVNLRRTLLRDLDGTVHSIPNGQISVASNLTRTWSRVNTLVSVSYSEDLDKVFGIINRVGEELAADSEWSKDIIEAPKALGVEDFGESGVVIRILGDTQPIRQWDVMRELRKRLKIAFDEAGIEIPFPHRALVTMGAKAAGGLSLQMGAPDGNASA